jgi:MFS transporter, NNP family, nitrate/nitrite transporter
MGERALQRPPPITNAVAATGSPARALALATVSFTLSFAAWGLIGGLATVFTGLYGLTASQTALLVAVPVLLGSVARLPMGMLTDRLGGRLVFTLLLGFSSIAAFVVPSTGSYNSLLVAAFLIGMAGSSFSVGAAFVSRWTPPARQGTALGIYGMGNLGQSLAVFGGPVVASDSGGRPFSRAQARCSWCGRSSTSYLRVILRTRLVPRRSPRWRRCSAARRRPGCSARSTS